MAGTTIDKFAQLLDLSVEKLISQLEEAGIKGKQPTDPLTDEEKQQLLSHLKSKHGQDAEAPEKVTLRRKQVKTLNVDGKRKVSIEVRKKRTYVKRSVIEEQRAEEEAKRKAEEEAKRKAEEEARKQREAELEAKRKAEEAKRIAEEQAKAAKATETAPKPKAEPKPKTKAEADEKAIKKELEADAKALEKLEQLKKLKEKPKPAKKKPGKKKKGLLDDAVEEDDTTAKVVNPLLKKDKPKPFEPKKEIKINNRHGFKKPAGPVVREVRIPETITVAELADRMAVKATEVIKKLMMMGEMATINQSIDQETAVLVVEEFGHKPVTVSETELEEKVIEQVEGQYSDVRPRPPVVTIMGHVDHGKTSLLDYIRNSRVTAKEAGGITQHIGAYSVELPSGRITFIDTPGHEAFTAMRARGAKATDVAIIVVAADDGVMPQTIEAIQHAKSAGVAMIVAINKIDKETANPDRVMQELVQHEVVPEEWGGDVPFVKVSAKTGQGVDELLETILLVSEILELKAPYKGPAKGVILESRLDKGRGPVATVLVQAGTLHKGDMMLAGTEYGRVRSMINDLGKQVKEATPSTPVEVIGLSGVPAAGDEMLVVPNERKAKEVAEQRKERIRQEQLKRQQKTKLEAMFNRMGEAELEEVNVIIKADVQGSLEALRESLTKLSTDEVKVNVVSAGVGAITETDVNLAMATHAIIIGFNVRADATARKLIEQEGVDVHYFSVIYDAVDTIKRAIEGKMAPEFKEEIIGVAEVRDVFRSPKFGAVAGCMVTEGVVKRNNPIRVLRDNTVIYTGELESLRRFKEDVQEVRQGMECGIGVKDYNDVRVGDQIEVFERVETKRTLD
ncbi:bacterial translation initiation factor 2 (bIF-2) [Sulfurivirga caldicuralii]|uniref:Translation initiation factor IF-2 n=1 Tax=Sulfurivirga caldicuralii TaxID=364032 RepID=A0A1N6FGS8_9GAMM|nr:translation initiation factor IF-2 [Sulfurivirga caldicuralii]SIN94483.1 bacterial translation initiation factor 2 (bIF-2) [Sulfurivirga caldicuralii]